MTEEARKLAELRFFRDLIDAERMKVFKAFGLLPQDCTETLSHGIQRKLFNEIAALRPQPGTLSREEVARRDESIDPQGLLDHAMLIEAGGVPAIRAATILREAAKIMQRFVDTRDMRRAELARLYAIEKSPSHEAGTQEPVAWRLRYGKSWRYVETKPELLPWEPLYAAPASHGATREMEEIDYDDPRFNQGVEHVVDLLAKTIGSTEWSSGDGSEDYNEDLAQTLLNILAGKGLYDRDTGAFASPTVRADREPK